MDRPYGTRCIRRVARLLRIQGGAGTRPGRGKRREWMQATQVLLQLTGNVVLLLWGLHMVQTGLVRACGADLRRLVGAGLGNRWTAFLAGLGVTMLLQSSTATGLMVASFTATGMVSLMPA